MTAIATVANLPLPVEPGGEACYELTVRNVGTVVDAFTVEPLGETAPWTVVEPAELALFPGAEGRVTLRFQPPRAPTTRAGEVPWAVRLTSRENPELSWVEEGVLDVAPFIAVAAELAPQTSRARGTRRGRHQLAIDNRGNVPTAVRLFGGDDDGNVTVQLKPATVTLLPGTAQIAAVRVRARKRFWRGPAKSHPFRLVVDRGDGGEPEVLPATLLQETVVPAWLVKALIGLILVSLLLVGLWKTVLKPTIGDAARAAAAEEAAEVAKKEAKKEANAAAKEAVAAAQAANGGKPTATPAPKASASASAKPTPKPSAKASPPPIDPLGNPVTFRVATKAGQQDVNRVLSGTDIVSVTDLFFQNPEGDAGRLEIFRDGDLIYSTRLNNWRDLDQHANAPYEFKPDDKVRIKVSCENKSVGGAPVKPCTPAVTLVGYARKPAE